MKINKNIFLYIFVLLIFVVFLWALYLRINNKISKGPCPKIDVPELYSYSIKNSLKYKTSKEFIFDVVIPHKFCGIIRNKNINVQDHNSHNFCIITKKYYFMFYLEPEFGGVDSGIFDYACIGDSIFKNSNSLIISIKRNNVIKNFNVSPYEEFWKDPYYNESEK